MQHDLDRRFLLGGLAGAAGVTALTAMAKGGPLNPPPGAVIATGKPLTDVEPRIAVNNTNTPPGGGYTHNITASGSYYLTADVVSSGNNYGIQIAAPRVTLDLNGFSLINGGTGQVGVLFTGTDQTIVIRNGTVAGWVAIGIAFNTSGASATHLEDLVLRNSARGIRIPGPLRVSRCTARNCSILGFECVSANAFYESCVADSCPGSGFYLNPYSSASNCAAVNCGTGFFASDGCRLSDCSASGCSALGFDLGSGVLLHRATARSNGTALAPGNGNVRAGLRAAIYGCVSTGGTYRGILTGHASHISDCLVGTNSGVGVETGDGSTIDRCNIADNGVNGLHVANNCRVTHNVIDYHAGVNAASIRCTGGSNSIEQNQLSRAAVGVDMSGTVNNLVLNNRISCGSPFVVNVGGNWYPAVAAASTGSASTPFANVTY